MADLPLLIMLLALAAAAWRQPWVGLLGVLFVGILHPQNYAADFLRGVPIYSVLLGNLVLAGGWDFLRNKIWPRLFWDWRIGLLIIMWGWFALTTYLAINPLPARDKLLEVTKLLPPILLILLLIDTKEKLRWLLLTIALSIAAIILKGGYWAVITGFHDRVYGPPGSAYGGNNEFAIVTTMAIPLLVFWHRSLGSGWPRWVVGGIIALGFAAALSSWSRGGLLSLLTVASLMIWQSRRKWLAVPLLLAGMGLVLMGLPDAWFARMQTLVAPGAEESAASRLLVWRMGWDYALQHPVFGGGFQSWIMLTPPDIEFRAWHSAYVQMAAEHGLVGLVFFGALMLGTIISLSRLIGRARRRVDPFLADQAAALRASLMAYLVGAAFLSIAYWELLYLLVTAALVLKNQARLPKKY